MKLLLHLAASLAAIVLIPRPAGAQSTVGNLTCFRISDPMSKAKFQVTLGSEAGSMHCTLKAPANRACIATSGTVVSPPPPEAGGGADVSTSFLCYQARCSPGPGAASLEDAFGRRAVALVAPKSLCLPASSGGFTTTTTVVGTTTPPSVVQPSASCARRAVDRVQSALTSQATVESLLHVPAGVVSPGIGSLHVPRS